MACPRACAQPPVAQINWRWVSAPWQNHSSRLPGDLLRYCTTSHEAPGNEYIQTHSHPFQPFPLHTPALSPLLCSWFASSGGLTPLTPYRSQAEPSPSVERALGHKTHPPAGHRVQCRPAQRFCHIFKAVWDREHFCTRY